MLPVKNQVNFAGAAWELIDFCQQRVVADGLFVDNRGYEIFALQFVKPLEGDWRRANRFTNRWAEMQGVPPDSNEAKQWFRNDPTIDRLIEEQGKLGLGPEADEAYLDQ